MKSANLKNSSLNNIKL
ncbi:hypothetical protein [Colwellia sp. C1TZA3]